MFSSLWSALFTEVSDEELRFSVFFQVRYKIYFINVLYLTIGMLLLITYGSANCSRARKLAITKDATPDQSKKAVVEHSVRISFHNDLPKSEGSSQCSPKPAVEHHARNLFMSPDRTQSGAICSKDIAPTKHTPKLYLKAKTVVGKSLISDKVITENKTHINELSFGNEKLTDDKTQISAPSSDFTQLTAVSEGNSKQSSKTLTESAVNESKKQAQSKNAQEYDEAITQNISINQVLKAAQNKKKQHSEVEESESVRDSIVSLSK
ncbi:unnamed protein product [Cercopithifilaria johnstoni]|uniref:Uncharacterized protein n=1 Tax=Cercopithifilaria johnstoni TaxID=2874296 RepID=A0A8J2MBT7_9BILA|nr:unnamed protein product [Cercopithifilaria johnstoni]